MNWIISKTNNMNFHTNLNVIFEPLKAIIENYNWIITDLEFGGAGDDLPINMDEDYFVLSPSQFRVLTEDPYLQIVWGVIIGVPPTVDIKLDRQNLPYAENNSLIWKNGNLQYPGAEIEIICFDSGYTIVKFADQSMSEKFKIYFDEAIELEKFAG